MIRSTSSPRSSLAKGITNNENDKLYVMVGIQDIQSGTSIKNYRNNAAMYGTDWMIVGEKTDGSVTYAAELDIMGHETNHVHGGV